jgi:type IV pilus assembly protein PilB
MLTVAMTNPTDFSAIDDLKFISKLEIEPVIVGEYTLRKHLERYYGVGVDESQMAEMLDEWGDMDVEVARGGRTTTTRRSPPRSTRLRW